MTQSKLIKLAIRHAEISAEIKINKDQMFKEISLCTGIYDENKMQSEFDSCLTEAYSRVKEDRENMELDGSGIAYNYFSFDDELANYGCDHCNASRRLKVHIGKLKQERGRIHSALTNIGKAIKNER